MKTIQAVIDPTPFIAFANGYAKKHARSCEGIKKQRVKGETRTVPCEVCEDIVRKFSLIPIHLLSDVLSEPLGQRASFSLGTLLLGDVGDTQGIIPPSGGLHAQAARKGRKAARDFSASYRVLKTYEQRGGGI